MIVLGNYLVVVGILDSFVLVVPGTLVSLVGYNSVAGFLVVGVQVVVCFLVHRVDFGMFGFLAVPGNSGIHSA